MPCKKHFFLNDFVFGHNIDKKLYGFLFNP